MWWQVRSSLQVFSFLLRPIRGTQGGAPEAAGKFIIGVAWPERQTCAKPLIAIIICFYSGPASVLTLRDPIIMYIELQRRLVERIQQVLHEKYGLAGVNLAVDQPPNVAMGEYAIPVFPLAKSLRKAPKMIADEIVAAMGVVPGFVKFEVAGGGYINARVDRAEFAQNLPQGHPSTSLRTGSDTEIHREKVLVEHTSINPNKAAHIGHLRNAILGDTFVRLLRASGRQVAVQNYIDNTGVQVADVVVGFQHLEKKSKNEIQKLIAASAEAPGGSSETFDYYCWELYARVSQWYEQSEANKQTRLDTLHAIEQGGNDAAEIGEMVSIAVLRRHLQTMERLDIEYDFLPRESEILHLHFWDAAFTLLKQKGVLTLVEEGKNKGCWVMKRDQTRTTEDTEGTEENQKVIVRSNGTVTYVGKDIAYHLWKFGLLEGKDFGYRKFFDYGSHTCWISCDPAQSEAGAPHFGGVGAIYNVIDSRQSDPQNNVIEALRALGYEDAARNYTHFSYEMVALTPRCAQELGYTVSDEDKQKSYIEVSGRKGFGVKADDLLDKLIAAAKAEVDPRHPDLSEAERLATATKIAIGALRYFMLKFTKNSVIAFDFKDALSFEGETGPYCQYAIVRASNIFRKAGIDVEAVAAGVPASSDLLAADDIWELWLTAGRLDLMVEQCIATAEPAYLAKYAFQLAQQFNNFYHKHHILTEEDAAKKQFLLATTAVVRQKLIAALRLMGVEAPEVM
jgi:arginyl-tRNA synthetase